MSQKTRWRFRITLRTLVIAFVVALLISYWEFETLINQESSQFRINLIVPFGLIAIFISLYLFSEFNRVKRAKRYERREQLNERRNEMVDKVIKAKNKNGDPDKVVK